MTEQEAFYKENRQERGQEEILLSARLGGEALWRIRPMSQRENEEIWKGCGKDAGRYEGAVLAASVCFPDLRDAALQNSYGAVGAAGLLARMLLPGEYDYLRQTVEKINGGDAACTECI